jgi:hypothetical protein
MTYELQTLNKGKIEAGFFSVFVQEVRMNEFSIPTDEFCRFVAKLATGRNSLEVVTTEGNKVKGSWDQERKVIWLGQYEIRGDYFGAFADYVFHGGFLGWDPDKPEWKPDYVKSAIDYVREHMSEASRDSYLGSVQQKQLPRLEERL